DEGELRGLRVALVHGRTLIDRQRRGPGDDRNDGSEITARQAADHVQLPLARRPAAGDLDQEIVAANRSRRPIQALGGLLAPPVKLAYQRQAALIQPAKAAQAPPLL